MASGSQYLEENGNGSKATRNDKVWDLDGDGGKKRINILCHL